MSDECFTLDTNLLVYVHDATNPVKQSIAATIVRQSAAQNCLLTLQSIGECFVSLRRVLSTTTVDAARRARLYAASFRLISPSESALHQALAAAETGRFAFWDAFLLAAAADAGCTTCLSEDMDDGAKLGTITVRKPFAKGGLSSKAQELITP